MLLSLLLILLPQNEPDTIIWEQTRVHELLELQLPNNLERFDTLNQTIFTAESDYSIIILSLTPESSVQKGVNFRFSGQKELGEFYDGMETGTINTTGGELINSSNLKIDSLNSRDYLIQLPNEEQKRFLSTMFKDQLFTLSFWYHTDYVSEVNLEIERTLKTINFGVSSHEQLNPRRTEDSQAYKLGQATVYLLIPGIIFLIYSINKRMRKKGV